ncbi:hypothetical protein IWW36_004216, partial [Coemansia brasiliensis]
MSSLLAKLYRPILSTAYSNIDSSSPTNSAVLSGANRSPVICVSWLAIAGLSGAKKSGKSLNESELTRKTCRFSKLRVSTIFT